LSTGWPLVRPPRRPQPRATFVDADATAWSGTGSRECSSPTYETEPVRRSAPTPGARGRTLPASHPRRPRDCLTYGSRTAGRRAHGGPPVPRTPLGRQPTPRARASHPSSPPGWYLRTGTVVTHASADVEDAARSAEFIRDRWRAG